MTEPLKFISNENETILSSFLGANIAEFICHEAFREYYNIYKKKLVPESYVEFIFEEYKKYAGISGQDLKYFFSLYKKEDLKPLIEYYLKSNFAIVSTKRIRGKETYYKVTNPSLAPVMLASDHIYGKNDIGLYSMLERVAKHINSSDEIIARRDLYEKYMLKKFLKKNFKDINNFSSTKKSSEPLPQSKPKQEPNKVLVGNTIDVPNLGGKVSKLFFPKLSLPSAYPVSLEKSRINSNFRVRNFVSIEKQIGIINQYKFNTVKYHKSFIEKRKAAMKLKKKKFDFDF